MPYKIKQIKDGYRVTNIKTGISFIFYNKDRNRLNEYLRLREILYK